MAADGRGTNVLTTMTGGAYTISAATVKPNPEVIIEYVPPANTPAAPRIESATHKADGWSKDRTARLTWSLPSDVTAVRTAWDNNASTIPTKVYNPPIKELTLPDLTDGVSFFHLQFQNKDGWGKVAHYRLAVDTGLPDTLALMLPFNANLTSPLQVLYVQGTSTIGAPLVKYVLQLNGGDAIALEAPDAPVGIIQLPPLNPGYQTVIIEVFDAAGNSRILTQSFTIEAFAAPVFTDYPAELTPGIIPVIKGTTRPASTVTLTINLGAMESRIYTEQSDSAGVFTFIPEGSLAQGVYTITAVAKDSMDAISLTSAAIKIAVQPSGIIRIGNMLLSVLTIVVSLLATVFALILLSLYTLRRFRRFQTMLKKEAAEVTSSIDTQFHHILLVLAEAEEKLRQSRKSQTLTQSEQSLVTEVRQAVETALHTIEKEADDVTMVVERSK